MRNCTNSKGINIERWNITPGMGTLSGFLKDRVTGGRKPKIEEKLHYHSEPKQTRSGRDSHFHCHYLHFVVVVLEKDTKKRVRRKGNESNGKGKERGQERREERKGKETY
jgi:hypothetical protein